MRCSMSMEPKLPTRLVYADGFLGPDSFQPCIGWRVLMEEISSLFIGAF